MRPTRALAALAVLVPMVALAQVAGITPGGPPVVLSVPSATALTMNVSVASEIQIDATAVGADAQLALMRDGVVVTEDSDGGEGVNARIVTFVAPGTYEVAIWEWRGGPLSASVSAVELPALPSAGAISPDGEPLVVSVPAGDSTRNATAEVTLTIATAGEYVIDAVGPGSGCDPQLVLVLERAEIARDSDGGEESDARFTGHLEPGTYGVRVHDWINRACTVRVSARAR